MGSLVRFADAETKNHKKVKHFATKVVYIHTAISNAKSYKSIAKRKYFVNLRLNFTYKV